MVVFFMIKLSCFEKTRIVDGDGEYRPSHRLQKYIDVVPIQRSYIIIKVLRLCMLLIILLWTKLMIIKTRKASIEADIRRNAICFSVSLLMELWNYAQTSKKETSIGINV